MSVSYTAKVMYIPVTYRFARSRVLLLCPIGLIVLHQVTIIIGSCVLVLLFLLLKYGICACAVTLIVIKPITHRIELRGTMRWDLGAQRNRRGRLLSRRKGRATVWLRRNALWLASAGLRRRHRHRL